jgi:hypothetical protein
MGSTWDILLLILFIIIFLFFIIAWVLIVIAIINLIWKLISKPGKKSTADYIWIVLAFLVLIILLGGLGLCGLFKS